MKGKIEHLFFDYAGIKIEDGVAYTNYLPYYYDINPEKYPVVLCGNVDKCFTESEITKYLDNSFVPNIGDEIHVVPDCVLATQDLRNNYKLKRNFDEGVCNVFSPASKQRAMRYHHFAVCKEKGYVMFLWDSDKNKTTSDIRQEFAALRPNNSDDFELYVCSSLVVSFCNVSNSYYHLLTHSNSKPCILYSRLPMKRNQLEADLLYMLYRLGCEYDYYGYEKEKAYAMQLSVLAQTNWKCYPGTMGILFEDILRYRGVANQIVKRINHYPKQVREIVNSNFHNVGFVDDNDKKLAKNLLEMILNIGESKFVTLQQLDEKLNAVGVSVTTFLKAYDTMIKITPKQDA